MITDSNIIAYLHSLEPDGPCELEDLRRHAEQTGVPVIRREMEPFLRVILKGMLNHSMPGRILEIGAGIGYSALFMHSVLPDAHITTIENYEPRLQECRNNLSGCEQITLLEGDAVELLPGIDGPADLIFLDAAKAQYICMLPDILRILRPGGVLIADNVLQDGEIVRSRYITPRRQRTIHSRMREFLWEVKHCPELTASVIPIGDGVVLGIRNT